jgi:hypothetical protein
MSPATRTRRPPLPPEILAAVRAGARHKKQFGPLSREQTQLMVRSYRAAVTERRKPGRKPDEVTLKAVAMIRAGASWSEVFRRLGYHELDRYERTYEKEKLRKNGKAYMKRNRLVSPSRKRARGANPQRHSRSYAPCPEANILPYGQEQDPRPGDRDAAEGGAVPA